MAQVVLILILFTSLKKNIEHHDYHILCDVVHDFPFPIYFVNNKTFLESIIKLTDTYVEGINNEDRILFIHQTKIVL